MFNPRAEGHWPNLTRGLHADDFWLCVDHSTVKNGSAEYNRGNKILFMQAARVKQFNLDRAVPLGSAVGVSAGGAVAAGPGLVSSDAWWVQAMLRELGLYTKKVDGLFGPISVASFAAFSPDGVSLHTLQTLSDATLGFMVTA